MEYDAAGLPIHPKCPEDCLKLIYGWLGEDLYSHHFEYVEYEEPEFDRQLGAPRPSARARRRRPCEPTLRLTAETARHSVGRATETTSSYEHKRPRGGLAWHLALGMARGRSLKSAALYYAIARAAMQSRAPNAIPTTQPPVHDGPIAGVGCDGAFDGWLLFADRPRDEGLWSMLVYGVQAAAGSSAWVMGSPSRKRMPSIN